MRWQVRAGTKTLKTRINQFLYISIIFCFQSICTTPRYRDVLSLKDYCMVRRNQPYIWTSETKKGGLLYYGALHTIDPYDPQIKEIEKLWDKFSPTVAFCEGSVWPLKKDKEDAIIKYGEQGLLRFLSALDNVSFGCLDPSLVQQTRFLVGHFPASQIKTYYVLREAVTRKRIHNNDRGAEYGEKLLRRFRNFKHLLGHPQCLHEFNKYIKNDFPELKEWQNTPCSYFYYEEKGKYLTHIHEVLFEYRNQMMLRKLIKALKKGERIFAVVGRGHVVAQEKTLMSLFSDFN